mgnify:CR=1 FL=1|tara:strand:- start:843 stop:1184 length:342 start_codon:yes stop_codon:yes gene_type:complete
MSKQFDFNSFNKSNDTVVSKSSDADYFFNVEVSTTNPLTNETIKSRKRHDDFNSSVASAVDHSDMTCYLSVSSTIEESAMKALVSELAGKGWTMQPLAKSKSGKTFGYIINPE